MSEIVGLVMLTSDLAPATNLLPEPPRKKRRALQDGSKRGCLSCRARGVICDQTFPICTNCLATDQACEGLAAVDEIAYFPKKQSQYLPLPFIPQPSKPANERRRFYYYLHQTGLVHNDSGRLDSDFWVTFLPALADTNDMAWDALIAIAALNEHAAFQQKLPTEPACKASYPNYEHRSAAMGWYSRALSKAQEGETAVNVNGEGTRGCAMLSCLLFMTIELLLGNPAGSLPLIQQAFRILATCAPSPTNPSADALENAVAPMLLRYAASLSVFAQKVPEQFRRAFVRYKNLLKQATASPLEDLRARLFDIMHEAQLMMQDAATREGSEFERRRSEVLELLKDWWREFCRETDSKLSCIDTGSTDKMMIRGLRMLYKSQLIHISCCFDASNMRFDSFKDEFSAMLEDMEILLPLIKKPGSQTPAFLFDLGPVNCACFVAQTCRWPVLRRKALDILRQAPRQECLWTSLALVKIAESVIAFEEGTQGVQKLKAGSEETLPPQNMRFHVDPFADLAALPSEKLYREEGIGPIQAGTILRQNPNGSSSLVVRACRECMDNDNKTLRIEEIPMF